MFKKVLEYFSKSWYDLVIIIGYVFEVKIMKEKYKAIDFANWFLWYNEVQKLEFCDDNYDVYEGLTHLKIQKLLYFADGVNLAINDKPLFEEKIYAWQHGPVVKDVYTILSKYGRDEIPFDSANFEKIKRMNENEELHNLLVMVYDSYAGYTAWQLREKSHVVGGPWQITVDTVGMQKEIKTDLIRNYFQKNIVIKDNE